MQEAIISVLKDDCALGRICVDEICAFATETPSSLEGNPWISHSCGGLTCYAVVALQVVNGTDRNTPLRRTRQFTCRRTSASESGSDGGSSILESWRGASGAYRRVRSGSTTGKYDFTLRRWIRLLLLCFTLEGLQKISRDLGRTSKISKLGCSLSIPVIIILVLNPDIFSTSNSG